MERSVLNRLQATLLAVATAGLVLLAGMNFLEERHAQQPDDGVWWREAADGSGLIADKVLPGSPGEHAGIKVHDLLTGVSVLPKEPVGTGLRTGLQPHEPFGGVKDLPEETGQHASAEPLSLPTLVYAPVVRAADLEQAALVVSSECARLGAVVLSLQSLVPPLDQVLRELAARMGRPT